MTRSLCRACLDAGWMSGQIAGFGVSGFFWMNPYIALSLALGGCVLNVAARVAIREDGRRPSDA